MLRRGINLQAPWEERWLDAIAAAGFDTVRLPVVWSAVSVHAVEGAVRAALARGLAVVLDVHHFDAAREGPRLVRLWEEIGAYFAGFGERVCFELLNEPHPPLDAGRWNALLAEALAAVRASNPERTVLVGPVHWSTVGALDSLRLPDDGALVATVHCYSPFRFTHQGASWIAGAGSWRGTRWGTEADRTRVREELGGAAAWARAAGVPLFLGEFGTLETAPLGDRAAWTRCVRETAESLGIGWCLWDFGTDFGAYDPDARAWREPLLTDSLGRR
jgi:endoglucanase